MKLAQQQNVTDVDMVIVGAGFAGLYMIHKARALGLTVQCLERGEGVGGTWYWNRYPGARCDIESFDYSFSFDAALQQEWEWTEKFATQPEILKYAEHVAERFGLRRSIRFNTTVTSAVFDEEASLWRIGTDTGRNYSAKYCIFAVGNLSSSSIPEFEGLEQFNGRTFHTASWPHEGVDFTGRRVGVIGTGSSGIQAIPLIAEQAAHLDVFQRTANYSLPALNSNLDPAVIAERKKSYVEYRQAARHSYTGVPVDTPSQRALDVPEEERNASYERAWKSGKYGALLRTYTDLETNPEANQTAAEFIRTKVRSKVKDTVLAEKLSPKLAPFGTKRTCLDTNYYETFNLPHVRLVDVRETPIRGLTKAGVATTTETYELDDIVFATGFDAMTGSILRINPVGRGGRSLKQEWEAGPRTFLGINSAGFPNLFFITGPGSPSVLSNMIVSIEQHVDWVTDLIQTMRERGISLVEASAEAQDAWVAEVNELAAGTLYPQSNSWYLGANIPGKPRVFMPYVGGVGRYRQYCDNVAATDYKGFTFDPTARQASAYSPSGVGLV
ncbi:flavin-containing monooxygenase [Arthrobacter crystallopoietes]|uniref:flavin-containing monooxygenase n=1 Tax=Crystallibacter crystallopoietes TaxID=37928 RepID=UPI00111140B8|nr:NAD(P)/FAD-dependent oxidoreductase [Arthrobacter crystallopoietes]